MWWIPLFLLVELTSQAYAATIKDSSNLKLVCYYANWAVYRPGLAKFTPDNINPYLCTHLIYAFAGFGKDYELKPFDSYNDIEQGNYRKFVGLKRYNQDLKTMIAIGGWNEGSKRFSKLVADSSTREKFIQSTIRYLRQNRFNGLDLDWEYPGSRDGSSYDDRKGYALLIKELREAFDEESNSRGKERLILSVAVPAGKDYIDNGYDVPEISRYVDFINVLTYDYHTAYEGVVNHHAPLHKTPDVGRWDERDRLNVNWTINYYLELGAPRHKLIVGVPTYGRSFTLLDPLDNRIEAPADGPGEKGPSTKEKGYLAYNEICQGILKDNWEVRRPYPELLGPYCYKDNQWVGFDDEMMVINKAGYIREQGLGGAMVWTLDNDDFRGLCGEENPLVTTLRTTLLTGTKEPPTKSVVQTKLDEIKKPLLSNIEESSKHGRRLPNYHRLRNDTRAIIKNPKDLLQTPKPPTTPDPGGDFVCTDEGFFKNPKNCKKYYWCLDSGPAELGIVPHTFTCPADLYFNPLRDSCDYRRNVHCEEEESTTKPTISKPSRPTRKYFRRKRPRHHFRRTTTTTTTEAPQTEVPTTHNLADLVRLLQSLLRNEQLTKEDTTDAPITLAPISRTLPNYVTPQRNPGVEPTTGPLTSTSSSTTIKKAARHKIPRYRHHSQNLSAAGPPKTSSNAPVPQLTNQVPRRPQFEAASVNEKLFQYVSPNRKKSKAKENKDDPMVDWGGPQVPLIPAEQKEVGSLFIDQNHERTKVLTSTEPFSEARTTNDFKSRVLDNPFQYKAIERVNPSSRKSREMLFKDNETPRMSHLLTRHRGGSRARTRVRFRVRPRTRESEDAVSSRISSVTLPKDQDLSDFTAVHQATRRQLRRRPHRTTTTTPKPRGPGVTIAESMNVQCIRQGVHRHPKNCSQFIVCAFEFDGTFRNYFHSCPQRQIFDETLGRCMFGNMDTCLITV
ncbi:probable chitinase 10 [Limulus polyphemus]|uniref:Probable chitinase 10 n=1 Tax=Limulus polyphemus TaxID=6850 RepID=A0ABM1T9C9_LIMPO|nr:probable chitinase 10 [Limulus polyphemus]